MRYQGDDFNSDLFQYDGTTLTEITSPVGFTGFGKGYQGDPILVGTDLYMRYKGDDDNYDLFKYDGTTLSEIASPAGFAGYGKGYHGTPILVGTVLYMKFLGDDDNYDLFKYDGTTLTEISSPVGFMGVFYGYKGTPIAVGSNLYLRYQGIDDNYDLFKYDGTLLTEISSPIGYSGSFFGYMEAPVVIGTDLYMRYQGDDANFDLFQYDGTTLTEISSPAGFTGSSRGYQGDAIVVGSDLYMRYLGDNTNSDLFVLSVCISTSGIDTQTACDSFTWIDGNTYTASNNTATHMLTNAAGCDSTVTLNLTINSVDVTTSTSGVTITANAIAASYQWLDCDSSMSIITGETNQSFTALSNGNYAVQVTENGCTDTSACINIFSVGIFDSFNISQLQIFPNPNDGLVTIILENTAITSIQVFNAYGKLVFEEGIINENKYQFEINEASGLYIISITSNGTKAAFKVF